MIFALSNYEIWFNFLVINDMNKHYIFSAITALTVFLSVQSAQAQVNLKSISVGASYWQPSLDYWNNRSFLNDYNAGAGAKLAGKVMPTAAIEVGLIKNLSLGAHVGYWTNSASGAVSVGGTNRSEDFKLAIIPVALDLKYTFANSGESAKSPFLTPYVGVSVARYFISNKFNRVVVGNTGSVNETQTGNSYGLQVFAGAEKKLVKMLYAGLDVRYHLGNYNQLVRTETTSTSEKVSLNGVEAGLSLRLKFD